jgi:hypothetical protein
MRAAGVSVLIILTGMSAEAGFRPQNPWFTLGMVAGTEKAPAVPVETLRRSIGGVEAHVCSRLVRQDVRTGSRHSAQRSSGKAVLTQLNPASSTVIGGAASHALANHLDRWPGTAALPEPCISFWCPGNPADYVRRLETIPIKERTLYHLVGLLVHLRHCSTDYERERVRAAALIVGSVLGPKPGWDMAPRFVTGLKALDDVTKAEASCKRTFDALSSECRSLLAELVSDGRISAANAKAVRAVLDFHSKPRGAR